MSLFELYIKGGFLMHFIFICSVFGFALFLYKFFEYKKIYKILEDKDLSKALINVDFKVEEDIEIFWTIFVNNTEKWLSTISLCANISTLLGLTGTVIGMIKTFMVISQSDFTTPKILALGIWEALLTTAFGLIVAVILHTGLHFLERKSDSILFLLKERILRFKNES